MKWVPCSKIPDTGRNVFIARGTPTMKTCCIGHYEHDLKLWYEDRNFFATPIYDGMYWCEIPPLPTDEQTEPQTCEECVHWNDTEDGCADRHGCKTEPQTECQDCKYAWWSGERYECPFKECRYSQTERSE